MSQTANPTSSTMSPDERAAQPHAMLQQQGQPSRSQPVPPGTEVPNAAPMAQVLPPVVSLTRDPSTWGSQNTTMTYHTATGSSPTELQQGWWCAPPAHVPQRSWPIEPLPGLHQQQAWRGVPAPQINYPQQAWPGAAAMTTWEEGSSAPSSSTLEERIERVMRGVLDETRGRGRGRRNGPRGRRSRGRRGRRIDSATFNFYTRQ